MNYLLRKSMNKVSKAYLLYHIFSIGEEKVSGSLAPFGSSSIKVTQENLVPLISPSDGERTMSTGTGSSITVDPNPKTLNLNSDRIGAMNTLSRF